MDKRNIKLAKNIISNSISLNKEENLLVELIGEDGLELANEIISQAKKMGANPTLSVVKYNELKNFLIDASEVDIIEYGKKDYERMKKMQAYIGISSQNNDKPLEVVPINKIEMYNKYYTALVHLEQRVKHTKWCILRYPNEYFANKSGMKLEEFKDFYYNVNTINYNKLKNLMEPLKNLMNITDKVHIVSSDTDLTFSIKEIPAEKYYGTFNLPDGEVATAPIKESVNGYITYNTRTKYNNIIFENIRFDFANGKIVKATCKEHSLELNKILDTDEGARYIGEFAFGLNPYINNTMFDTLFDEKINGSFHFTPGMALEESDNGNRSAIHWDIVKILKKEYGGGEIYFDGILIMKDGMFIPKELETLNSENLKNII